MVKDLGIFIDSKLHFHNHVDYIFSQCIKFTFIPKLESSSLTRYLAGLIKTVVLFLLFLQRNRYNLGISK
jgi:hypothetical protein